VQTPHLTDAEIIDMVAPLKQPAAIVRWFRAQGFTVREKPNGMPLVSRAHFEAHLSGEQAPSVTADATPANTPDVAAFLSRFNKGVGYGPHGTPSNRQPTRA